MTPHKNDVHVHISLATIVKIALFGIFIFLLYYLKDIVLIILTALVIASAIEPGTLWFEKHRIPRVLSVIFLYLMVVLLVVAVFYFLLPVLLIESSNLLRSLDLLDVSSITNSAFLQTPGAIENLSQHLPLKEVIESIQGALSSFSGGFFNTLSSVFGGVLSFVLILVLSFYFAVHEDGVREFLKVISPVTHQNYVVDLWKRSQRKIGLWLQGQILLGLLVGVFVYLGLTVLGVKHALVLAFLAMCFELIPLFGPILSAIPGIALAFAQGGVTLGLVVIGLYVIIQQFENHLIYPLVVNKVVGVSPVVVIVALLIGAKLAGFLGLLLSVPVSAALMEYYSDLKKDRLGTLEKM